MATPFVKVYDAFLAKITADEWTIEEELAIVERDWREMLKWAISQFKYPRVSLEIEEVEGTEDNLPVVCQFKEELTNAEIQLLATYMKQAWIQRCIASWEQIRQLYADKDFSQANMLDKLNKLAAQIKIDVRHAEGVYDRARNHRPASIFRQLAGKSNS